MYRIYDILSFKDWTLWMNLLSFVVVCWNCFCFPPCSSGSSVRMASGGQITEDNCKLVGLLRAPLTASGGYKWGGNSVVKCSQAAGTAETSRRGSSEGGSLLSPLGSSSDYSNIMWISQITLTGKHLFLFCFLSRFKYLSCCFCYCFMLFSFLVLWVFHHLNIKMSSLPP